MTLVSRVAGRAVDGGGGSSSRPVSWPVQTLHMLSPCSSAQVFAGGSGPHQWEGANQPGKVRSLPEPTPISTGALGAPSSFSRLCLPLSSEAQTTFLHLRRSGLGAHVYWSPCPEGRPRSSHGSQPL